MVKGLIGKKIGMTQVFDQAGNVIPATVIQTGPCVVVQKKTPEKEGYAAVQLGFVEIGKTPRVNKPVEGHFRKAQVAPTRVLKEFPYVEGESDVVSVGDQILVNQVFQPNDLVDVTGRTIGRGFQGVVKRHGFRGGAASHGSMFHRAPGSIGASAFPSRVFPGMRAPGHMGTNRVKARNLRVVEVDAEHHLLVVQGAIPGARGNYVYVARAKSLEQG